MIQIILLVLGIFAWIRYPKLARAKAEDFEGVNPDAFAQWHRAEKSAAMWLIIATVGVFLLQLVGGVVIGLFLGLSGAAKRTIEDSSNGFTIASVALFFALLIVAAIRGSKAAKLKSAAGVGWPKK